MLDKSKFWDWLVELSPADLRAQLKADPRVGRKLVEMRWAELKHRREMARRQRAHEEWQRDFDRRVLRDERIMACVLVLVFLASIVAMYWRWR